MKHKTREEWLDAAVLLMIPLFGRSDYQVPVIRVSCGWPHRGGTAKSKRVLGQCWANEAASDGKNQIFISPYLDEVLAPIGVLPVLVHEVVHAVVGIKEKHGKVFKKCATAVGLEGKMTSTTPGEELCKLMEKWNIELGDYPHAKLDLAQSPVKKQSTRMIKCVCQKDAGEGEICGYLVRLSKKWLEDVGSPHCPKHGAMEPEIPAEGEEDEGEENE